MHLDPKGLTVYNREKHGIITNQTMFLMYPMLQATSIKFWGFLKRQNLVACGVADVDGPHPVEHGIYCLYDAYESPSISGLPEFYTWVISAYNYAEDILGDRFMMLHIRIPEIFYEDYFKILAGKNQGNLFKEPYRIRYFSYNPRDGHPMTYIKRKARSLMKGSPLPFDYGREVFGWGDME